MFEDSRMSQAGATVTYNTPDLKNGIMKYAIACALTEECLHPEFELYPRKMNAKGTLKDRKVDIHFCNPETEVDKPFDCHRFDQSLFSVLVSNFYNFNTSMYRPTFTEEEECDHTKCDQMVYQGKLNRLDDEELEKVKLEYQRTWLNQEERDELKKQEEKLPTYLYHTYKELEGDKLKFHNHCDKGQGDDCL